MAKAAPEAGRIRASLPKNAKAAVTSNKEALNKSSGQPPGGNAKLSLSPVKTDKAGRAYRRWLGPDEEPSGKEKGKSGETLGGKEKGKGEETGITSKNVGAVVTTLQKNMTDLVGQVNQLASSVRELTKDPFTSPFEAANELQGKYDAKTKEYNPFTTHDAVPTQKNACAPILEAENIEESVSMCGVAHSNKGLDSPIIDMKKIGNVLHTKLGNGTEAILTPDDINKTADKNLATNLIGTILKAGVPKMRVGKYGVSEKVGQPQHIRGSMEERVHNASPLHGTGDMNEIKNRIGEEKFNTVAMHDMLMGVDRGHQDFLLQKTEEGHDYSLINNGKKAFTANAESTFATNNHSKFSQQQQRMLEKATPESLAKISKDTGVDMRFVEERREKMLHGMRNGLTIHNIQNTVHGRRIESQPGMSMAELLNQRQPDYTSPEHRADRIALIAHATKLSSFAKKVSVGALLDYHSLEESKGQIDSVHKALTDIHSKYKNLEPLDGFRFSSEEKHFNNGEFNGMGDTGTITIGIQDRGVKDKRIENIKEDLKKSVQDKILSSRIKTPKMEAAKKEIGKSIFGDSKKSVVRNMVLNEAVKTITNTGKVNSIDHMKSLLGGSFSKIADNANKYHGMNEDAYMAKERGKSLNDLVEKNIITHNEASSAIESPKEAAEYLGHNFENQTKSMYYFEPMIGKDKIDNFNNTLHSEVDNYVKTSKDGIRATADGFEITQGKPGNVSVHDVFTASEKGKFSSANPIKDILAKDHSEFSFDDPTEAVTRHEMGHAFNYQYITKLTPALKDKNMQNFAVTRRAGDNHLENIAENFTLHSAGKEIHPEMKEVLDSISKAKPGFLRALGIGKQMSKETSTESSSNSPGENKSGPKPFIKEGEEVKNLDGNAVPNHEVEAFVKADRPDAKVPGNWKDLKINSDFANDSSWLMKGTNINSGENMTLQSAAEVKRTSEVRDEGRVERFARVKEMMGNWEGIVNGLQEHTNGPQRQEAVASTIMALTGLRVGGDGKTQITKRDEDGKAIRSADGKIQKRAVHTFGVTSLQTKHVEIQTRPDGKEVASFDFIGKKAGRNKATTESPHVVSYVKEALEKAGGNKKALLFSVSDNKVNKFLQTTAQNIVPANTTSKDFRTLDNYVDPSVFDLIKTSENAKLIKDLKTVKNPKKIKDIGVSTIHKEVSADEFVATRQKMPEASKVFLTQYTPKELADGKVKTYLAENKLSGFALNGDELINVFSLKKGEGTKAVVNAIKLGGKRLDCLGASSVSDLPKFYSKFGFKEVKREKNWVEGEPDVIFMERK